MFRKITLALFLLFPISGYCAGLATVEDTKKLSNKAASLLGQEKIVEGFSSFKPYWPLPPVEIDGLINQTNIQWPMVRQRFGKSVGVELVKEYKLGTSFIRYVYLHKFERHAIKWIFTFYKPKDVWVVNAVSFDDKIDVLFE